MKLGPQTHFGAKSQSERTMQLVPKPRKMAIIIPRRRRGTWEGVTVATWWSELIYRMWGGLGPHTMIFPASLSLPPMQDAAIDRAPAILQNDSFYTRISNFVQTPILLAARTMLRRYFFSLVAAATHGARYEFASARFDNTEMYHSKLFSRQTRSCWFIREAR